MRLWHIVLQRKTYFRLADAVLNRISGVMVSMLVWNVVDSSFKSVSSQTKDYKIGICCISAKFVL